MPRSLRFAVRRSVLVLAASVLVLPVLGASRPALADDPASGETIVGELVQAIQEPEPGDDAGHAAEHEPARLSWIRTDADETVRVSTEDVDHLRVGSVVRATIGEEVADEASEDGMEPAHEVTAAKVVEAPAREVVTAPSTAVINHEVTVVMMVPPGGAADGRTPASVRTAVDGPVRAFWYEQTRGVVRLGVVATHDWAPATYGCDRPDDLWAEAARRANWSYAEGRHLLVYLPAGSAGCAYGLAEVRQGMGSGGYLYVRDTAASVIAHEFGHNFGLYHSSGLQCDATPEPTPATAACQIDDYRDYYDVMGASGSDVGTLNPVQANKLGVLPAAERVDVVTGGGGATVTLQPISATGGTRAIRLISATGRTYWVEYRPAVGRDSWVTPSSGLQSGVLVRRANPGSSASSLLLDPTPAAASGWPYDFATALPVGAAVPVAGSEFSVTVLGTGPTATVRVVAPGPNLPWANWEALSVSGDTVSLSGWAFDPDALTTATSVHVYIDGGGRAVTANGSRPDVGAAFPAAGSAHGFSWSGPLAPGVHNVCLYAIDSHQPWRNSPLGCRSVGVQVALPVANWEALSVSGSTVSVAGWAFDPDAGTAATSVHMYVDGQGTALTANGSRPDVGAAFPGAGDDHGFSWSGTLSAGRHTVCLYAIDPEMPWRNTPLGCRPVAVQITPPVANWEALSASGSTISVSGWAFDPDSPGTASSVHVYVDGQGTAVTANGARSDVGAAFPGTGNSHGFSWSGSVAPGRHSVCVFAIDVEQPWRNTALGCRMVDVQTAAPRANWEALSASGSTVTVSGWAFDPDSGTAASQVHVYVDGQGAAVVADGSRPDVGAAFPGAGDDHGFSHSRVLPAGVHTVCLYAVDDQISWLNTPLGCRSITT